MAIFTQNPDYTAKIVNVNETVVGESYKMSQVIADFNAIGIDCDSVIMHDWRGRGYGAFIPLKITEQNTYYVGDNDLTSGLGTNATLWQKSNTVWGGHYYRYVNGVPTDYGALSLGSQTVDNIEYWYDYDGNVSYIPLFYLDSSITVVINKVPVPPSTKYTSNGGGATHIAKVTGQLKDLSSNLSDILMVSGGGGGGLLVDTTDYSGKEAGGISGSGDNSADQSTGNAFGQGESGTNVSGGGSGLYGGYKGTSSKSGGAGSGYIGNSLVNNKKMVGYNVPTSSSEGTKTESANDVSASAVSGKPKSGNGFARIKFISDLPSGGSLKIFAKALDTTNVYTYQDNEWWNSIATCFSSYLGSNYILECIRAGGSRIDPSYDGESIHIMNKFGVSEYLLLIPIRRLTVNKLSMTGYTTSGGSYRGGYVNLMKIENNQLVYCSPSEALFQLPAVSATCEKTLNTPVEADYLSIQAGDGEIYISDVYFNE